MGVLWGFADMGPRCDEKRTHVMMSRPGVGVPCPHAVGNPPSSDSFITLFTPWKSSEGWKIGGKYNSSREQGICCPLLLPDAQSSRRHWHP
eukprot:2694833-Rhodomonas_salina.2